MAKEWYVLALADTGSDLLHCTQEGFESVELIPESQDAFGTQLDNAVEASVAQEGGRYVPSETGHHTSDSAPRATFTNNNVRLRGAWTEQHLTRVAQAVREQIGEDEAPLVVAMDQSQWALFQTVSGFDELPQRLDAQPNSASKEQLWELSRQQLN